MSSETYVRVNTATVETWKGNLEAINSDCLSSVENLKSISAGLSNWKGNSGTTADEIANSLISQATSFHHELESVDNFLQNLVITKTEQ